MLDKTGPVEQVVVIPPGLDCRDPKFNGLIHEFWVDRVNCAVKQRLEIGNAYKGESND